MNRAKRMLRGLLVQIGAMRVDVPRGACATADCVWMPFTDEVWRGLIGSKALAMLICRYSTDVANKALGASTVSLRAFGEGPNTIHTNAGSWGEEASGRDAHDPMVKCPPYTENLAEFVDRIASLRR